MAHCLRKAGVAGPAGNLGTLYDVLTPLNVHLHTLSACVDMRRRNQMGIKKAVIASRDQVLGQLLSE